MVQEKVPITSEDYQRRLLMDRSVPGRTGVSLPALDVPEQQLPSGTLLRDDLELPEVSEGEVVRYFTNISQLNFSIDTNFYPLGSCTMKYNPRVNEVTAALPGLAQLHPRQSPEQAQGALELLYGLQEQLKEVTGMQGCGLVPLASAAMGGFDVVAIPSDADGNMDMDALRREATDDLAGVMFTQPTTLGLFDTHVVEMSRVVHEAGGLVYGDGANMNAILGRVKLADLGFDVVHLNLHKTFSTPHGGGGPGAGPVCVNDRLLPFLPEPVISVEKSGNGDRYLLSRPSQSIGRLGGFFGSFGVLVRAYTYITLLGGQGMLDISANAVLNANYLKEQLRGYFDLPYDRSCMHEVVFSAKRRSGVKALDVAKRLLDFGFHAPTMYFPLVVDEALMIEPTETESKETMDAFAEALRRIDDEAVRDPDFLHAAPYNTPVSRLDEAKAARQPYLRWQAE
jgi:glycine dehydrogenase subunit 2